VESIVWSSPTEALIGPSGGTIEAEGLSLVVPEGAFSDETMIRIKKNISPEVNEIGEVFEIEPHGLTLSAEVEITLPLPMAIDADIIVMRLDPVAGVFEEVDYEIVDGTAVVTTQSFSLWATLRKTARVLGKAALCKAVGLGGDGEACCFGQCFGERTCNPPPSASITTENYDLRGSNLAVSKSPLLRPLLGTCDSLRSYETSESACTADELASCECQVERECICHCGFYNCNSCED
jgi:hypothetical protein